jgi:predicted dehydrogenase
MGDLSRRDFMKQSAIGASAALAGQSVARGFPANEKVQIGWVGIGSRWRGLAGDMIKHCPDARTAAVCDLIPDRIEQGKKMFEHDQPVGFTNMHEMMDKTKLDGILVATQPNAHAEVVVPILKAGIHCFCEKPMDTTVDKVDAIVDAVNKSPGVIFQIGTQRRFSPPHITVMDAITSGSAGRVLFMQGHWHWHWRPGPRAVARDGGFIVEQSSHHTDIMAWAKGDVPPATCVSSAQTIVPIPEGPRYKNEQQSATVWQWPDGSVFSYTHLTYLSRQFTSEQLVVHCERAGFDVAHGLRYGVEQGNWTQPTGDVAELAHRIAPDVKGDWGKGTKQEMQAFIANIRSGQPSQPRANVHTGRISTLMCIMARMAMVNNDANRFEPRVIRWADLGSQVEPV